MNAIFDAITEKLPEGWSMVPIERNPNAPMLPTLCISNGARTINTALSFERFIDYSKTLASEKMVDDVAAEFNRLIELVEKEEQG